MARGGAAGVTRRMPEAQQGFSSYTPHVHAQFQVSPASTRFSVALEYAASRQKHFHCYL